MHLQTNRRLAGTSIAPGLAMGPAFVYRDVLEEAIDGRYTSGDQVEVECDRVQQAAEEVLEDLQESSNRVTQQIGAYQAEIFSVHQAMLHEILEANEFRRVMEQEHVCAEVAVQRVFDRWTHLMQAEEGATFFQRADDVADIGRRLLRALMGVSVHPLEKLPEGSVLVAHHLLPSDAVFFAARHAAAIVVESESPGSHCALLTRHVGIPGVCNIRDIAEKIATGEEVLVDGFRGFVVVQPDSETQRQFSLRISEYHMRWAEAKTHCREPAVTPEGHYVPVMANIANRADVQVAMENGADGVGLYRLEALFMLYKSLPTEERLLADVSEVLAPLENKLAIVRLLDIGSEKHLPYLRFGTEPAPCLGMRGVRVLLENPELLKVQLRALLRLSQVRDIQIMVPMVTIPEDMEAVRQALEATASELGITKIPRLLAMVETPAAALCVPEILRFADALSIGTNDLTQYTMVAGRENPQVQRYFQDTHPAVMRLIQLTVNEAGDAQVGVCGELAGQLDAIPTLLKAGVQFLSVAPPLIPAVKEAVRHPYRHRNE
jgi:phosphotransferase system enzyme I (PtsI)